MSDLRRRIEALEAAVPDAIILTLADGSTLHFDGEALDFYVAGLEAVRKGRGKLFEALKSTVSATGCGNIWQVLNVCAAGPIECGGQPTAPLTAPSV
jgi:hypothetical protein